MYMYKNGENLFDKYLRDNPILREQKNKTSYHPDIYESYVEIFGFCSLDKYFLMR